MVDDLLTGKEPEVNDTKTYDNKVKVVPTFQHESHIVTKDNLIKIVVDSGLLHQGRSRVGSVGVGHGRRGAGRR